MIRRYFRGAAHHFLYRTWFGGVILDRVQCRTHFYDGSEHFVPYRIHRIFDLWRRDTPSLAKESRAVFDAYKGGDVIDVGAFNGWYSLLLAPKARSGDSFVSIEPDPQCAKVLATTVEALRQIYPYISFVANNRAVGDGSFVQMVQPKGSFGHPSFRGNASAPDAVETSLTLDRIVSEKNLRPSFIKIDVEGAEFEVLSGAQRTLREFHPLLMTELHPDWLPPGVTVGKILEQLESLGYSAIPIDELHLIWE